MFALYTSNIEMLIIFMSERRKLEGEGVPCEEDFEGIYRSLKKFK